MRRISVLSPQSEGRRSVPSPDPLILSHFVSDTGLKCGEMAPVSFPYFPLGRCQLQSVTDGPGIVTLNSWPGSLLESLSATEDGTFFRGFP